MQRDFLESILPNGTVTIWRRASYGPKAPINIQKWYSYPEDFEQIVAYVEEFSDFDVYVSPTSYTKESRELENVDRVKTIWLDADTCELDNLRVPPTWSVQSSPGRWQAWWILEDEISATEASLIVKKISYAHRAQGADVSSWAANKLMRVIGSVNSNWGFPSEVTAENSGEIYSFSEIAEAYADIEVSKPAVAKIATESSVAQPEDLPDYSDTLAKLPSKLLNLVVSKPNDHNRSELLHKILCELFRFDQLTFDEVLSIAWHAPACTKWAQEDPRGINGLIFDANKALSVVEYEREVVENTPRPSIEVAKASKAFSLLSKAERKVAESAQNFVTQYVGWAGSKTNSQNVPYDEMNAWIGASLSFADMIFIPIDGEAGNCSLYGFTVGQTTSGKSHSFGKLRSLMNEVHDTDPAYNLGGNASPQGLGQAVLERDRKISWFNKDEVHGWFKQLATQDWTSGLLEDLALMYDGVVSPMLRKSMKELSGKTAFVYFIMHLMGTPEELVRVLNKDMFKSGFLARFIWAVGDPRNITRDSLKTKYRVGAVSDGPSPDMIQFADEIKLNRAKLKLRNNNRRPMDLTRVAARLDDAAFDLVQLVPESDPNFDILNPSLIRMGVNVRRAATLLAAARGEEMVMEEDVYFALMHAEKWVKNLMIMASQISASEFERECDEVESWLVKQSGGRVTKPNMHNRFRAKDPRQFVVVLRSLEDQGRVLLRQEGKREYYFINTNKDEE